MIISIFFIFIYTIFQLSILFYLNLKLKYCLLTTKLDTHIKYFVLFFTFIFNLLRFFNKPNN